MSYAWTVSDSKPEELIENNPELDRLRATLLQNRGITDSKDIDEFLHPDYDKHVHDPFLFNDMKKAVDRLFSAIKNDERITIHGDYDADGVSASVILTDTLKELGAKNLDVYLPHRETDGYGLNLKTIDYLKEKNTNVIITCDCGISNVEEVAKANKLGMDVIITDHHSIPETIPEAFAIIHPKIETENYPDKNLAGGGVAFKLAQGLLRTHAKDNNTLPNGEKHVGFEKWLLDMVAIASVADMVPLLGESRTLTIYGLIVMGKTRRVGMKKLMIEAGIMHEDGSIKREINARTIGFQIAPRINAAGRLDHANVAYNLLTAEYGAPAIDLAHKLETQNTERRENTKEFVDQAVRQIEENQLDEPVNVVFGESWFTGISGLIAGNITNKYYKPTIAMAPRHGEVTGSGRSIEGFDLVQALQENADLFKKFGGHPMACGFTLKSPDLIPELAKRMRESYKKQTEGKDMRPKLLIDASLPLDDVNWNVQETVELFAPHGEKNPSPKFVAYGAEIVKIEALGKGMEHIKITAKHESTLQKRLVGWKLGNSELNPTGVNWLKELEPGNKIDVVYEVGVNEWNGNRELQLTIVDLRKAEDIIH